MNHQRENRTVPYTNASNKQTNKQTNPEINFTEGQKYLYSHGLQDLESGFKSQLTH